MTDCSLISFPLNSGSWGCKSASIMVSPDVNMEISVLALKGRRTISQTGWARTKSLWTLMIKGQIVTNLSGYTGADVVVL